MDDSAMLYKKAVNFLPLYLLSTCLLLTISTTNAQQIYKWIDEDGNVHYSDRPDPSAQTEQINIKPSQNPERSENPEETIKRLQNASNDLEASRQQREASRAKEQEALRKKSATNAEQEKETDKRESNRDRWYYGRYPQRPRPPTRPPIQPPINPQPPIAIPLPSNTPAGQ
ncbi:MAG: DUF4124 domain-containing protein [Thiohalomonadales bacterium]|nr:DUF4124 domain-containing protein [Thiohalomonadales bacterium]